MNKDVFKITYDSNMNKDVFKITNYSNMNKNVFKITNYCSRITSVVPFIHVLEYKNKK